MLKILLPLTVAGLRFDQLQSVLSIYCFIIPLVDILGNCATSKLLCLHLHAKKRLLDVLRQSGKLTRQRDKEQVTEENSFRTRTSSQGALWGRVTNPRTTNMSDTHLRIPQTLQIDSLSLLL